jgi:hypothetical protein
MILPSLCWSDFVEPPGMMLESALKLANQQRVQA